MASVSIASSPPSVDLLNGFRGIKALIDSGLSRVPDKYVMLNAGEEPPLQITRNAHLPMVDMESPTIVNDVYEACITSGIFYVQNHGVDTETILQRSFDFFQLPQEEKEKFWTEELFVPLRYCSSMTPSLEKKLEWHDHLQMWIGICENEIDAFKWPDIFSDVGTNYVKSICTLGNKLLSCMSQGLGLKQDALMSSFGKPWLLVRSNYFPPCPDPSLALGQDAHTDSGGMTILLQDQVGGLQIKEENKWVNVKPIPGTLVINMGDQMEKLTNGRFKSILHRVAVQPNRHRQSLPCFMSPDPDTEIAPIPDIIDQQNPAKYISLPYRDYMMEIYTKHFGGKNVY